MIALTMNVWHGLAGRGHVRFREFENSARREVRWQMILDELGSRQADLVLLQELNPLEVRAQELRRKLGGRVLIRHDQAGVKFLGVGLPENLSTGLGLLLSAQVRLVETESLQLSGVGFSGARFSMHLGEIRSAIAAWVDHPDRGRILVINTHLHHGFEATPILRELLREAHADGRVHQTELDRLEVALAEARDRRLLELDRLLEFVDRAERRRSVDSILIGGDLNSPPEGVVARGLAAQGWLDLHAARGAAEPTWDATRNFANHKLQADFEFPLPTFGNPELQKLYRAFDDRPRRIDYLWAKGDLARAAARAQLVFDRPNTDGFCASDHFGVMVRWS